MDRSFNIIVAVDIKNGIGFKGTLPWNLPADLRHFKEITSETEFPDHKNIVVMGRKTWDSLPQRFKPLPNRLNVVLTRNQDLNLPQGVLCAHSLDALLNETRKITHKLERLFVIGGGEIFRQTISHPNCRRIYLTKIFRDFHCDTFFPPISEQWKQVLCSERFRDGDLEYCFMKYVLK